MIDSWLIVNVCTTGLDQICILHWILTPLLGRAQAKPLNTTGKPA